MRLDFSRPGIHETPLREYFDDFDIPVDASPWPGPVCIVLFVNRSGSSLIGEYMRASNRFSGFGEPLNHPIITKRAKKYGLASFADYFRWLSDNEHIEGTQFGFKASCDQVIMLLRSGAIPRIFPQVRWVVLQREDVLLQAVSLSIAAQTKRWHTGEVGNRSDPEYDFVDILHRVHQVSQSNGVMAALTSLLGVTPYHIRYEDFSSDPERGASALASHLGVSDIELDTSKLKLRKQRSELNQEFCQRFIAEFASSRAIELPGCEQ